MNYHQYSDVELASKFIAGDQEAFAELVRRYARHIYNLAYRFTRDVGEAEDLVQDVFFRVYKALPRSETPESSLKPWILRIATNLSINWVKKKKKPTFPEAKSNRELESFIDSLPDESALPSELFEQKNLQEILQEAISRLPLKYQPVVVLRYSGELTFEEIASVLNIPVGTAKIYFFRAKKLLREFLKETI